MTSYNNPSKSTDGRLTDADYQALATFRYALRKFTAFSEAAALTTDLMPQQHQALLVIKVLGLITAPTVGEVADQLMIRHHSAVELIGRLARMELVERVRDPMDRRRIRISLTSRAEKKLAKLSTTHLNELRAIRPMLVRLLKHFDS